MSDNNNNYSDEDNNQYENQEQEEQYDNYEQQQEEQKMQQIQDQRKPSYQSNKSVPIPDLMGKNEEEDEERQNLWKTFGRETGAGKALFGLYKSHKPAKINYPKLKTKPRQPEPKVVKKCPQKTVIEYPEMTRPSKYKFHQIDFVMRRKPESQIKEEIDNYFSKKYVPLNRGKDRQNMVKDLQKKFKDQRGGLPKAAEMPQAGKLEDIVVTDQMAEKAMKRIPKKDKVFSYNPEEDDKSATASAISQDPMQELEIMFEQIMQEIQERQQFVESVKDLNDKNLKEKVKKEIVERVSELQKITELKKYYKEKEQQHY